jgi:hypothetical protein
MCTVKHLPELAVIYQAGIKIFKKGSYLHRIGENICGRARIKGQKTVFRQHHFGYWRRSTAGKQ